MKSFSQFLVEKESISPYYDQYGKRIPWSEVTRQDIGMAPKDLKNVTPESETKPISKSGKKSKGNTPVTTKVKSNNQSAGFKSLADQQDEIRKANELLKTKHPQFDVKYKDGSPTVVKPNQSAYAGRALKGQSKVTASIPTLSKKVSITKDTGRSIVKLGRVATDAEKTAEFIKTGKNINRVEPTVNLSDPKKYKGFIDRVAKSTGVESPITKKLGKPSTKVTGSSVNATKKLITKARVGGLLKGAGRFAGGAFAAKDAYDKARIEKVKGRSKTSQILGGIARGAGGYLGGAIGATLGTVAGGGVGSAVLGTGGAIAGYNVGTKVGDFIYDKGRKLATGKYKFPTKTFKNLKKDINTNVNKINLRNLGRMDKDKK